ncbi:MAG: hypothetical protein AAGH15_22265 [Myxococcota bacterium]
MSAYLNDRITTVMAAASVVLVGLASVLWGAEGGLGACAGALVANLNWATLRVLTRRIARAGTSGKGAAILFVLKSGALLLAVWLLVTRFGLHFKGLTLGFSALVLGIALGPLLGGGGAADGSPREKAHGMDMGGDTGRSQTDGTGDVSLGAPEEI